MSDKKGGMPPMIVREKELPGIVGVSRSTIRREMDRGTFPKPVHLGPRAIGWRLADLEEWRDGLSHGRGRAA